MTDDRKTGLIVMFARHPIAGNLLDKWGPRLVYIGALLLVAAAALIGAQLSAAHNRFETNMERLHGR